MRVVPDPAAGVASPLTLSLGWAAGESDLGVMVCPASTLAHTPPGARRGLTLLEALLASAILVIVVTAVMSAVSAGAAQSDAARRGVSATLACDMLMARITGISPDEFSDGEAWFSHFTTPADTGGWDGHMEEPGNIRAGRNPLLPLLPDGYQSCSLRVAIERRLHFVPPPLGAAVYGVDVSIEARDEEDRSLHRLNRFLPLPQVLAEVPQ
ncbi:MAG: hypothetical protein QF733_01055 [Phycisphaerales bacterium]|nr:hypothetical protein [Phycisphaerales bacterium]